MNPKFLICQFRPGDRGPFCEQPIGQSRNFGIVVPDRHNETAVTIGVKYLCREVRASGRVHFVMLEKPCSKLLEGFLPTLVAAPWKRGPHATSEIFAEAEVPGFGRVKAEWFETPGRRAHKFVCLQFEMEGESLQVSLGPDDAPLPLAEIENRVRKCVGPAVALGAVISRQSDSRRSAWR